MENPINKGSRQNQKLILAQKATKIWQNLTILDSYLVKVEAKGYFVAFLENLNYNSHLHITLSVAAALIGLLFKEGPTWHS